MRLYHTTANGEVIRREGFRDGPTSYAGEGGLRRGVWLADRVMTEADFSDLGQDVLTVEIPAEVVAPFEQPDDGLPLPDEMEPYRAFVVPAEIVNRYPILV